MAELFESLPFENLYWSQMETLSRTELRTLQTERLRRTVEGARELPMYREFFAQNPLSDDDFQEPEDVAKLPFTTLADLRGQYPSGLWTVPRHMIARIATQNGFATAFTRRDMEAQADAVARFLYADGVRSNSLVQVSHAFGRSGRAFALQSGVDAIGAASVPATNEIYAQPRDVETGFTTGDSVGETLDETLTFLETFRVETLCADAEIVLALCSREHETGRKITLKMVHTPATANGIALRYLLQKDYGLKVFLNWAHPAFYGAGMAGECYLQDGMHLQEDRFLFELLSPETLLPVSDNTPGELVVTDLRREAQSLLRFRTGTLAVMNSTQCPCGRTGRRIQILR